MKTFLAIFMGTPERLEAWTKLDEAERKRRESEGMQAWNAWGETYAAQIVDQGSPLGKTKKAGPDGVSDMRNGMAAYVLVKAETHDAAAKMFVDHPHFSVFPGSHVEIMECLPMPAM